MYFSGKTRGRSVCLSLYSTSDVHISTPTTRNHSETVEKAREKLQSCKIVIRNRRDNNNYASVFTITAGQVEPFGRSKLEGVHLILLYSLVLMSLRVRDRATSIIICISFRVSNNVLFCEITKYR